MALSKVILEKTKKAIPSIEKISIKLLIEAYNLVLQDKKYELDWIEDQFTNYLINFMKKSYLNEKYPLDITPQYPLIQDELPINENNPKFLPIIDIRIFNWNSPIQKEYFFEAKNLCENNWKKKTGTIVSSTYYLDRYVSTGIENFRTGRYYSGAIIGYVLQGNIVNIISKLNARLLSSANTIQEIRNLVFMLEHNDIYNSKHITPFGNEIEIKHLFLKFN